MTLAVAGQVGPAFVQDGVTTQPVRMGKLGDIIVSELHGRFYETAYRGNLFFAGTAGIVALSANTITLSATSTPILGIYNPPTSGVNVVMLQASLSTVINTVTTPVGSGAYAWASSVGNTAVSTGLAPWNAKTMQQSGSQVKSFAGATALTGLTNNLTIMAAADFPSITALTYGTIANTNVIYSNGAIQNFDGSLIVPPGGVLSLVNTTSTTTVSVVARMMWEEVPV
jgi:hypothetical protein